ncbi:transketolase [Breznakiella homolactica]|uniref:Transketolase n=1 Tax=Breznakiella homolactica TaxID=2798577 RepID=A0A7T7XKP6_9SPIR|nr:transketolase [Breznakiella homolactica]QQO08131.1 transketolase [Breznakiella homolactica]
MGISEERAGYLENLCRQFRIDVITQLYAVQTGHPGGSLSVCEILTALYFEKARNNPQNPNDPGRDRIILSKGHAAPMLYRILAERGYFPADDLKTLRQFGSHLQGHPCSHGTKGVEVPTGPLGLGLGVAVGKALSLQLDKNPAYVYCILGDGELNEGTIWESAMSASKFKLDNLIVIVDRNHVQLDGTDEEIMPLLDLGKKFDAFGFRTFSCEGHSIADICDTIDRAKDVRSMPSVIIAETVKGKGVSYMEGQNAWHGNPINSQYFERAIKELEATH